ncbi:hypothetical protein bsdcttw_18930 [Anaerocolumna chitinilytica]|uniref:Uncharacterized protein n=1 Tax=Anaerocolumna chitinilytica TaxID=1727145 RepID=A0A7I8DKK1_9FIRM|nr:hypothetical protein bsdcttw_18930 [Anaerocolumna chitinilytica]
MLNPPLFHFIIVIVIILISISTCIYRLKLCINIDYITDALEIVILFKYRKKKKYLKYFIKPIDNANN